MIPSNDLNYIFAGISEQEWGFFKKKRIFITGGSGFIGKWLVSGLLFANERLDLNCEIEILTRYPEKFCELMPQITNSKIVILRKGDIKNFEFGNKTFDIIIHGATDVIKPSSALETFDTCFQGTKRILDFAKRCKASDFLLTSSGAVYGKHPSDLSGVNEGFLGAPDVTLATSAYGEGKRVSEWLSFMAAEDTGMNVKVARIYAQVGPYLPLDKHFAIGNFIQDALSGRTIKVLGDGTPIRSYLYAADTALWLLAMMIRGKRNRVWNLGGDEKCSIAQLANKVANILNSSKGVCIYKESKKNKKIECYVPDVRRAKNELRLPNIVSLDDSILRTADWVIKNKILK